MRAIFTVGVLDCFMDHEIWFPYTIGVSAGASNGISYASRQRGRSRFSNIDLLEKYDYIGFRHFLRGRGYIDMKYLFYIYPEKYYPLDYETYFKSPNRFVMVTSNCLTGKAEYFEEKQDADRLVDICCASCTLPVLCPVAYVDGVPMVGALASDGAGTGRLVRFGYITLTAKRDGLLLKEGESVRAHEFHYYDSTACGDGFRAEKQSGAAWDCVVTSKTLHAGYPHIHFWSNPETAASFIAACKEYGENTKRERDYDFARSEGN